MTPTRSLIVCLAFVSAACGSQQLSVAEAEAPRPVLLFKRLQKAGGMFSLDVLQAAVGDKFQSVPDSSPMPGSGAVQGPVFRVGAVRNPCEYYASLWAFASERKGSIYAQMSPLQRRQLLATSAAKSNTADLNRFHMWLTSVASFATQAHDGQKQLGLLSARMWTQYTAGLSGDSIPNHLAAMDTTPVLASLKAFKPHDHMDCWLSVETLAQDMRTCLTRYESRGGVVDWANFQKTLDSAAHNKSTHATCPTFYTPESEALVRSMDRFVFEGFGYKSCCGPQSKPTTSGAPHDL